MIEYIANSIQQNFGVTKQEAMQSSLNIITNYANCAGISTQDAEKKAPINIKYCYDNCFAAAHAANPKNVNLFEIAIIKCMCSCAEIFQTQQ